MQSSTKTHLTNFHLWTQLGQDALNEWQAKNDEAFYNKEQQDLTKNNFLCVGDILVE